MNTLKLYLVEFPEHDYDTIKGAAISAYSPREAKALFIAECNSSATADKLEVSNITLKLSNPGIVHSEFHAG